MIRIKVLAVGKTREEWIKRGTLHYSKILGKYARVEMLEVKEEKITRSKRAEDILEVEADRILRWIKRMNSPGSPGLYIALEREGGKLGSEDLAHLLEKNVNRGYSEFVFILGGTLGLSPRILDTCQIRLSLSRMTFTHEMSRVILLEQLYRAFSILKGTDYHK